MTVNRQVTRILSILLLILLLLPGCGEVEDDGEMDDDTEVESVVNSQPLIGAIPDQKVDEGDTVEVEVRITDLDPDDIQTISASSNDTDVATVSVMETRLSVAGITEGTAIIEVVATDDSGQDNAASIPVTFNITVIENLLVPKDPAYSDLLKAMEDGDDDLVEELFNRAKKLRAGLEFPRDTFAVNEEHTILIAHTPEGNGLLLDGGGRIQAGLGMQLGWLTFSKRGAVWVLTHYDP